MTTDPHPTGTAEDARPRTAAPALDPRDIAPWVIASVRAWPRNVDDSLVALAVGVQVQHVKLAREARP